MFSTHAKNIATKYVPKKYTVHHNVQGYSLISPNQQWAFWKPTIYQAMLPVAEFVLDVIL